MQLKDCLAVSRSPDRDTPSTGGLPKGRRPSVRQAARWPEAGTPDLRRARTRGRRGGLRLRCPLPLYGYGNSLRSLMNR